VSINRRESAPFIVVGNKLVIPAIRDVDDGKERKAPSTARGRNLFCHPYVSWRSSGPSLSLSLSLFARFAKIADCTRQISSKFPLSPLLRRMARTNRSSRDAPSMMLLSRFRSSRLAYSMLSMLACPSSSMSRIKKVSPSLADLLGGMFVVIQRRRFRSVCNLGLQSGRAAGAAESARDDIFSGATLLPPQINAARNVLSGSGRGPGNPASRGIN